jgi:predicted dehydrogenase
VLTGASRDGLVRVAVAGFGVIGRDHLDAYLSLPGVEVAAVYDPVPARAVAGASLSRARAVTDFGELLNDPGIDAVSLCAPDHLHKDGALALIAAGKHVLVEKPLAATEKDARQIHQSASEARTGTVVMVGQTLRYIESYQLVQRLVVEGAVGQVSYVYARRCNSVTNGRRVKGLTTVSLFLGVHDLDFLSWTLGRRIVSVSAVAPSGILADVPAADATLGLLQFAPDASGVAVSGAVEFGWALPQYGVNVLDGQLRIVGTEGMITLSSERDTVTLTEARSQRRHEIAALRPGDGLADPGPMHRELGAFVDAVRSGGPSPVPTRDGLAATLAALALDESARTGQPVRVSPVGEG